jgi:hypothetical protein
MEKINVRYCNGAYSYHDGMDFIFPSYQTIKEHLLRLGKEIDMVEPCNGPKVTSEPKGKVTRRCCQSKYKDKL